MKAYELLAQQLEMFRQELPQAEFRESYEPERASRLLKGPVAAGAVKLEKALEDGWEAQLEWRIYLPRSASAADAEPLLSRMEELTRQSCPLLSTVERGPVKRENATGFLEAVCVFSFSQAGSSGGQAWKVVLGGKEYEAAGVKTSLSNSGKELVSIGEEEPFAVLGERSAYTVELSGIRVSGLERMTGFTAEIGQPPERYLGCRWKSLSPAGNKAVFVSYRKEEGAA